MSIATKFVFGGALGAGLMWFLDVQSGTRRRAILRDKALRYGHRAGDAAEIVGRDLFNRSQGVVATVRGRLRADDADDEVLRERVRSKLGRVCSHPHAIEVAVHDGRVALRGPVLSRERRRIVRAIRLVRGVAGVEDALEVHREADVPALAGGARRIPLTELGQEVWSPAVRFLVGSVGAGVVSAGLRRGGVLGIGAALLGGGALARSLTNEPTRRLYGLVGRRGRGVGDVEIELLPEDRSRLEGSISIPTASAGTGSRISIH